MALRVHQNLNRSSCKVRDEGIRLKSRHVDMLSHLFKVQKGQSVLPTRAFSLAMHGCMSHGHETVFANDQFFKA